MTYQAKVTEVRLVEFPEELARELDLASGNSLVIERENGKLVIKTFAQVVCDVQSEVRRQSSDRSGGVVDELLAERRAEGRREAEAFDRWMADHG